METAEEPLHPEGRRAVAAMAADGASHHRQTEVFEVQRCEANLEEGGGTGWVDEPALGPDQRDDMSGPERESTACRVGVECGKVGASAIFLRLSGVGLLEVALARNSDVRRQ